MVISLTRFGTVEFFLCDAEVCDDGCPIITGQSDSLEGILSFVPEEDRAEFLNQKPTKVGQKAINLFRHPVKVRGFNKKRGVLVECLGTGQRWYADPDKLVLAS